MEKEKILIEDLQFLYTDMSLHIIDPANVHFLQSKTSLTESRIKFDLVEKTYILQKFTINEIIKNNI